jgi:polysaccharide export outer membrane protein
MTRVLLAATLVVCIFAPAGAAQTEYVIGPQDVLSVTVFDQADLSGKFTVDADGTFSYPLIGRVKASGLTIRALETELKRLLSGDYLKNPQVTVEIATYKSQRVFVHGEVKNPGTFPLTGDMTLIEALAQAGSTTSTAGDEALIVRPKPGTSKGPMLPGQQPDAEVIHVNLKDLQAGTLAQNLTLRDGDTIVVPKGQPIYVFGQVKMPGAYTAEPGMTVLQALALAGGVTDRGSTGRVKIVRIVDGKKTEIKVQLTDLVSPGDTIVVPERFF